MPEDAREVAEKSAAAMWQADLATRRLGMELEAIAPGEATLSMVITAEMVNGHGTCHGGYVFTLADSAFAFACNTYGVRTVAAGADITYVAPALAGDRLLASAVETARYGRSGIYDVTVTNGSGEVVAIFRGRSRTIGGSVTAG